MRTTPTVRTDHHHYLAHWVKLLGDDATILWRVASHAQRAAGFITGKYDQALHAAPEAVLADA